ncbi:MAG: hypothetical protein JST00_40185 [Deltaproteobacteria bacterium]|nr:hypothetical protein [Deltaproteobacteria bacterium]
MPSFARRSAHPARPLPRGVLVGDIADRGRAALTAFLRLAARGAGVDRAAVTEWLFGAYLEAISLGQTPLDVAQPTLVLESAAEQADAAGAVARAAMGIEGLLRAFHAAPDLSVGAKLVDRGIVEPVIDERAARGYAPIADPTFLLGVRVLSITAAELLTRPERLFNDLVVTESSVEIVERSVGSGVTIRSRQTLPWRPEGQERASAVPARPPTLAELVAEADGANDAGGGGANEE